VFANASTRPCTLLGYPGVAGLDASGRQVVQAVRSFSGYLGGDYVVRAVRLEPGGRAAALVEGTDVPSGSATSCLRCPRLLVTAPGQTESHPLSGGMPDCSPLQVHPVVAGTTGGL